MIVKAFESDTKIPVAEAGERAEKGRLQRREERKYQLGFGHYHLSLKDAEHALFSARNIDSIFGPGIVIATAGYEALKVVSETLGVKFFQVDKQKKTLLVSEEEVMADQTIFSKTDKERILNLSAIIKMDRIKDFNSFVKEYKKHENIPCIDIQTREQLTTIMLADLLYRAKSQLGKNASTKEILDQAFDISKEERKYLSVEPSLAEYSSLYWGLVGKTLDDQEVNKFILAAENSINGKCCPERNK
ncbi:hypothetical protein [Candidatus Uabimicrobium sp. HlEnr_7]|uniref:hypothetical protein n=1 Tax=Candidatus Uabimicrobium helgolandensis TaxID=3095367 RepID=UPI003558A021